MTKSSHVFNAFNCQWTFLARQQRELVEDMWGHGTWGGWKIPRVHPCVSEITIQNDVFFKSFWVQAMITWLYRIISDLNHANPVFFKDDPFLKHFKGAFSHRALISIAFAFRPLEISGPPSRTVAPFTPSTRLKFTLVEALTFHIHLKKASQALSILIGISFSTIRLLAFFQGLLKNKWRCLPRKILRSTLANLHHSCLNLRNDPSLATSSLKSWKLHRMLAASWAD